MYVDEEVNVFALRKQCFPGEFATNMPGIFLALYSDPGRSFSQELTVCVYIETLVHGLLV